MVSIKKSDFFFSHVFDNLEFLFMTDYKQLYTIGKIDGHKWYEKSETMVSEFSPN